MSIEIRTLGREDYRLDVAGLQDLTQRQVLRVTVKDDVGRAAEKAVDTVAQVPSDLLHPFGVGVRRRTRDFNAPRL